MSEALGFSALLLNLATIKILANKGFISRQEVVEALDNATLLIEQMGLAGTEQGAAVHGILEQVLQVVSSDAPRPR